MTLSEYQVVSGRYEAPGMDREQRLRHSVCGLASEVCELIEDWLFGYTSVELVDEAGDVCWFMARVCAVRGLNMSVLAADEDAAYNVRKYGAERSLIGALGRVEGVFQKELTGRPVSDAEIVVNLRLMLCAIAYLCGAEGRCMSKVVEKILEKNIEKLKVRYPDGFTVARALNRDRDAEAKVFGA